MTPEENAELKVGKITRVLRKGIHGEGEEKMPDESHFFSVEIIKFKRTYTKGDYCRKDTQILANC